MVSKVDILVSILVIVAAVAFFLTFQYIPKCNDVSCWDYKLQKCSRASFVNEKNDVVWNYKIVGKVDGKCEINVRVIEIKRGLVTTKILEGKDMDCRLPIGTLADPDENPNLCHGILKEEMQNLIIQKLHQYVVQNIGEINEEVTGISGISGSGNIVGNSSSG